jgi:hypothetical protein
MSSWAKGFMAGCSTAIAATLLISVLMLPSIDVMAHEVQNFGTKMISEALPFGGRGSGKATAPPGGRVDMLESVVPVVKSENVNNTGLDDFW